MVIVKIIVKTSIVFMFLFGGFSSLHAQSAQVPENGVIAYYFHGNFRCVSCRKIEEYTKETIENDFSRELARGELVFDVVNIEKPENSHFVEDYQLYTRSVVIVRIEDGKEVKYKNLEKVWEYLGDKQKFSEYVRTEINNLLKS